MNILLANLGCGFTIKLQAVSEGILNKEQGIGNDEGKTKEEYSICNAQLSMFKGKAKLQEVKRQ